MRGLHVPGPGQGIEGGGGHTEAMRAALGPEPGDDEEVRILNRVVRWERDRITYEADEKHVHTVTNWVGLQPDSKGSEVPLTKDYDAEDEDQETDEGRLFRKLAATVN